MDPDIDSTAPDAAASTAAAAPTIAFKKKGAKRKEYRAPAQSLTAVTGGAGSTAAAAAGTASSSNADAASSVPVEPAAVSVEDDTHNDDDAIASTAAPAAAASAAAAASTSGAAVDSDDSDDDDPSAPRASIAFSAADAARAAAEVEEEEPEDAADDAAGAAGSINRPQKRAKKDNPLVQTTRNKLKKDLGLTIQSQRSVIPESRTADKQITQSVDSSKVKRSADPTKSKWSGPSKPQASNVRMISRFDYQPDICKDYKETGRCGYGDSCKFMHDRGDYLQGWQVEKNWNEAQEAKRKRALQGLAGDEEEENFEIKADEELPWACLICREPFTNPVVTKCKHYYCEKCALEYYTKDTKCFACRAQTHGIFNAANELLSVLKKRADAGVDKKSELEEEERLRNAAKQQATGQGWAIP